MSTKPFDVQRFLRDMERSAPGPAPFATEVPAENFFGETYPLEIVALTVGLPVYLAWLRAPQSPPEALVTVAAQLPHTGRHSILSANAQGCVRQLAQLGVTRGQWLSPHLAPDVAHLRYHWLQWEHDTGRVHSHRHLAAWTDQVDVKTMLALKEGSPDQVSGVEPWYGPESAEERRSWAWGNLQRWIDHQLARGCFDHFVQSMMPSYQFEEVHVLLARVIETFSWQRVRGIILNVAPRAGKSQQASILAPPWQIGQAPWHHLMSVSYARALSARFGGQARALVRSPVYQDLMPHVQMVKSEAGEWTLVHRNPMHPPGEYYASGVQGGIAGRGFHVGINDDLLSEQDMHSQVAKDNAWDWWHAGFRTREMDPSTSVIGVISTRYAADDPVGRILKDEDEKDRFKLIKIPALLKTQEQADLLNRYRLDALKLRQRRENFFALSSQRQPQLVAPAALYEIGSSFSPIRRPKLALERVKRTTPTLVWSALYDQEPSLDEGNVILKGWWRAWEEDKPPFCDMVLACYDTAFEEDEQADYSARTTWGLFYWKGLYRLILLEAWRDRVPYYRLKAELLDHHERYKCDLILIEKKATGHSLLQDLQQSAAPVQSWLPPGQVLSNRSKGKLGRGYGASPVFEAGLVYYMPRSWAKPVLQECGEFPAGESDDWYDTVTMAALWLRTKAHLIVRGDFDPRKDFDPEDVEEAQGGTARERALAMLAAPGTYRG